MMSRLGIMWFADAPEMAELGLIEPLGNILSQLSQGGGAKGINIDAVSTSPVHLAFIHRSCFDPVIPIIAVDVPHPCSEQDGADMLLRYALMHCICCIILGRSPNLSEAAPALAMADIRKAALSAP